MVGKFQVFCSRMIGYIRYDAIDVKTLELSVNGDFIRTEEEGNYTRK